MAMPRWRASPAWVAFRGSRVIDAERQAAEARAANDNERAEVLEIEAVILDREPQPKIGHIATALERQGERTERGDLWRAVMARNFARLRRWLTLQQDRLATAWQLVQAVFERGHGRVPVTPDPVARDADVTAASGRDPVYSQEERDRLVGRARPQSRSEGDEVQRGPDGTRNPNYSPEERDRLLGRARPQTRNEADEVKRESDRARDDDWER